MLNNIKIVTKAIWDTWTNVCGFFCKVTYFPWRVVFKLWHWVYDEK